MPELPEVETIVRDLEGQMVGLTINQTTVHDARVINASSPRQFSSHLTQQQIARVSRRGKAVIMHFTEGTFLIIQPKMTGQLILGDDLRHTQNNKDTKVTFGLSNGRFLNYNDQRLFGKLTFVKQLDEVPFLNTLGPEPFERDVTPQWFKQQLAKRTSPIKPLLLNQTFIAGIGNIYASEILFEAKIHPEKRANRITRQQVSRLHEASIRILNEAIAYRGSSMRNYRDASGQKGEFNKRVRVYAREDEPCVACRAPIKRIVQAGRSTFFCQKCQR